MFCIYSTWRDITWRWKFFWQYRSIDRSSWKRAGKISN